MKINKFFTDVLGANLKNPRWSWGATDPVSNRVFLRVWEDELESHNGHEYILVAWNQYAKGYSSNGINERRMHVDELWKGAEG